MFRCQQQGVYSFIWMLFVYRKRKPHPKQRPEDSMDNNHDHEEAPPQKQVTVDDMYGANKAYPEPYTAGIRQCFLLFETI